MSSTDFTPKVRVPKKRYLSSPCENSDHKRSTPVTMDESMVKNITFSHEDLAKISEIIKTSFITDIHEIVQTAVSASISSIVDGVLKGLDEKITSLESENSRLKSENDVLKKTVKQLEASADSAEQYSRRNNIRLSGCPETPNEIRMKSF